MPKPAYDRSSSLQESDVPSPKKGSQQSLADGYQVPPVGTPVKGNNGKKG